MLDLFEHLFILSFLKISFVRHEILSWQWIFHNDTHSYILLATNYALFLLN